MKMSVRDRWILAFFPGLLLLIVYQYGVAGPLSKSVAALKESSQNVDPKKTGMDLNQALKDVQTAEAQLEDEKKLQVHHDAVFPEDWKDADRTRTLQELSRYFEESGVLLLESTFQKDRAVEGALLEFAKNLKDRYGAPDPQLWKFELSGSYTKVTDLLKRLAKSKRFVVPVTVDMKVEEDSTELTWTVTLWI